MNQPNHQQGRHQYQPPQQYAPPSQYPTAGHYSAAPPAAPEPPKKKRKWPWVVGGFVALIVLGSAVNGGKPATPATSAEQQPAAAAPAAEEDLGFGEKMVTLTVEGSGKATVTYMKSGGSEQKEVNLPWSAEIKDNFISSLVAQKKSGNSSEITCRITEGSEVIAESTSSGPYAMTTCTG